MGDRANIYIKNTKDSGVYLYTHWDGSVLPTILQEALRKKWRWDDDAYLARIIFCRMVKGAEAEECGYGISAVICDGNDRVLEIDCEYEKVVARGRNKRWSFQQYCDLSDAELGDIW